MRDTEPTEGAAPGPERKRRTPRQRLVRALLAALSLGLFGAVLYVGGVDAWRRLLSADWRWLGLAFGCTALLTAVTATRWGSIANGVAGRRLCSTRAYYHYLMMGHDKNAAKLFGDAAKLAPNDQLAAEIVKKLGGGTMPAVPGPPLPAPAPIGDMPK